MALGKTPIEAGEGGGGIAGTQGNDGEAGNLAEAQGDNAAAADLQMSIARGKDAACRKIDGSDQFARNAASPQWAKGFDELLGSKRTT